MRKKNTNEILLEDSHGGILKKRVLVRKNEVQSNLIFMNEAYLDPGKKLEAHKHLDMEEIFYILEGSGILTVGDENENINNGDVIVVPLNHPHCIENTGRNTIKFLTIAIKV